ncbi:MucBP domain-containing protein [Weissella kandleri]|uniref:MucBP domain-containing protein n=1 Tax=Weissella kandleri TaxID=1616 RepID=UPI00387E799D
MKLTRYILLSAVLLEFINPLIVSADSIQSNDKENNNLSVVNETKPSVKQLDKKETSEEPIDSWMPDKELQKEVWDNLQNKGVLSQDSTVNDITKENISNLTYLNPYNVKFTSLKGLEYATNLEVFDFHFIDQTNSPLDYSPLLELKKLHRFLVSGVPLSRVPVSELKYLTDLCINGTSISDQELKSLVGMKRLTSLIFDDDGISDNSLKIFENATHLSSLELEENNISDVTPLKNLNNTDLYLDDNHIYDISSFANRVPLEKAMVVQEQDVKLNDITMNKQEIITSPMKISSANNERDLFGAYVLVLDSDDNNLNNSYDLAKYDSDSRTIKFYNLPIGKYKIIVRYNTEAYPKMDYAFNGILEFNMNVVPYVTAKYVDEAGNKISDDVVKSGEVGEQYTTEQKDIKNYTFKEVQGSPSGTFTDEIKTVTYVYKATPNTNTPTKPANPNTNMPELPANPGSNMPTKPVNPKTNMPELPANPGSNMPTKPVNPKTNMPELPANPGTNMPTKPVNPNTNMPELPANPGPNMPTKPVNPKTNMPELPANPGPNMPTKPVNPKTNMPELPANPGTNMPTKPVNPNTNMPQLPANPGTNMPALPVIDDNGGNADGNENNTKPGTNNNNSSSNLNNDDIVVDNVINKVQSSLPKTAAEKVTLAGIVSVVLALLAGLVIRKKHK